MLDDKELGHAAAQLAEFQTESERHHEILAEMLQKYRELMDDYKRLRSDYEEERDSRERYKQMARGQERNPFVLVLIDGDGYVFDDDLVSGGAEGGQKAARLLNDTVKSSLRNRGLDHCRIMVRVYANLAGLSKALSKCKLSGPEKRSIAPFTASFTRSNDLFDFVDAGELKENADFKIRAMFRQFADNAQCRHIYFGGCHDSGYLSELTPYVGNRDRITLIRTHSFHPEYLKLGIRIEDFPNIFRMMPLEGQSTITAIRTPPPRTVEPAPASGPENTASICLFFQKGICKYGKACRNAHIKTHTNGSAAHGVGMAESRDWRQNSSSDRASLPLHMSHVAKSDNDFMSGNLHSMERLHVHNDPPASLPRSENIPRNEVPVNKYNHRLDAYIPPPTHEDKAAFQARIAVQKLCNNHHLQGHCPNNDSCEYDHSAVSQSMLNCLKTVVRNNPCPRKGACRSLVCLNGHVCQKADCKSRGGRQYCKFGYAAHNQPFEVADYAQGMGNKEDADSPPETLEASSQASNSPIMESRGIQDESDGEQDQGEGALLSLSGLRVSAD